MTDEQSHIARQAAALDDPRLCRDIEDMTDTQEEAPVRVYLKPGLIRQAGGYPATLTFPDHPRAIEYVRSDLARPSQAGEDDVKRLVEAAETLVDAAGTAETLLAHALADGMIAEEVEDRFEAWRKDLIAAVRMAIAALAAMDTPKGGGDE